MRDSQRSSITCLKVFLESEEGLAVVTFGTHASGVLGQYHPRERLTIARRLWLCHSDARQVSDLPLSPFTLIGL